MERSHRERAREREKPRLRGRERERRAVVRKNARRKRRAPARKDGEAAEALAEQEQVEIRNRGNKESALRRNRRTLSSRSPSPFPLRSFPASSRARFSLVRNSHSRTKELDCREETMPRRFGGRRAWDGRGAPARARQPRAYALLPMRVQCTRATDAALCSDGSSVRAYLRELRSFHRARTSIRPARSEDERYSPSQPLLSLSLSLCGRGDSPGYSLFKLETVNETGLEHACE